MSDKNEILNKLIGKSCLVTAGPTYEAIDPVRFIGNRSSGKMGLAIAESLANKGVKVSLVIGPNSLKIDEAMFEEVIRVESSDDMYEAVIQRMGRIDIGVFCAAVADYKPKMVMSEKIKKQGDELTLELVKTKDILKEVGFRKKEGQFIVGFALETNNELLHAMEKIKKKNLDMIVLNSLRNQGAGFQHDTNKISIIDKENNTIDFELKTKKEVADDIVNYIHSMI